MNLCLLNAPPKQTHRTTFPPRKKNKLKKRKKERDKRKDQNNLNCMSLNDNVFYFFNHEDTTDSEDFSEARSFNIICAVESELQALIHLMMMTLFMKLPLSFITSHFNRLVFNTAHFVLESISWWHIDWTCDIFDIGRGIFSLHRSRSKILKTSKGYRNFKKFQRCMLIPNVS